MRITRGLAITILVALVAIPGFSGGQAQGGSSILHSIGALATAPNPSLANLDISGTAGIPFVFRSSHRSQHR
jgi:hypothetical protein